MQWRQLQEIRRKQALAAAVEIFLPRAEKKIGTDVENHPQVSIIHSIARKLRECNNPQMIQKGKCIHSEILSSGLTGNPLLGHELIHMYARCGSFQDSEDVFNRYLADRDVEAWNSLITAVTLYGEAPGKVLRLYRGMCDSHGVEPNTCILLRALSACSSLRSLADGRSIHRKIISGGFDAQASIVTALIKMYGKCGSLVDAQKVFDRSHCSTTAAATWNSLIACYSQSGHGAEAIKLYRRMSSEGVMADEFTISIVSTVCDASLGREIQARAIASGAETQLFVGTSLVRMHARLGDLNAANESFERVMNKDIVCWTILMAAYIERNLHSQATLMFRSLVNHHHHHLKPDSFTFSTILSACVSPEDLELGREIHQLITGSEFEGDVIVGTALVSMYGRCRAIEQARLAFERIEGKNLVSWNAMLGALADSGCNLEMVELFRRMDLKPDALILSKILSACTNLGDASLGKRLHRQIQDLGLESETIIQNGLVSMYSSCGNFETSKKLFDGAGKSDPVFWNSMISAACRSGKPELAILLGKEMGLHGVEADEVTLTSLLHACAHAGLVDEGVEFFRGIASGVSPQHFHCMIDLFGRMGMISEAEELILNMPFEPDEVAWTTLVSACQVHVDTECAIRCVDQVSAAAAISGAYLQLSNLCSRAY